MKNIKTLFILITFLLSIPYFSFAAESGESKNKPAVNYGDEITAPEAMGGEMRIGGQYGKGTDAIYFDDNSLIATPVPTSTPIYKMTKQEIELWENIRNTKDLLYRCRVDLERYEKFMRKEFMNDINNLKQVIASMHTYALLNKRDVIEHLWNENLTKAQNTLALCEEYKDEFQENYVQMESNQKALEEGIAKYKNLVLNPEEIQKEYELNKKDMFFIKKKIDYFTLLYEDYVSKFNQTVAEKDKKVEKLLAEHYELHKP
ncbi:MAG TPA: hypothetical protein PLF61_03475 [Candidatus Goldiibacteriota bacterium]|nr:hypothetical protein [Candidatus Goldiibacteriota bacterium]